MEIVNKQVLIDLANGRPLCLELAGGPDNERGYYNIERSRRENVDILADLNEPLDLIPNDSVAKVYSSHVLEHIQGLEGLLNELYRMVRPDGTIESVVPHFSNPYYYSDPTHVRPFGLYSMSYFVAQEYQPFRRKVPVHYTTARFQIVSVRIEFFVNTGLDRLVGSFVGWLSNRSPRAQEFYERYVSRLFPARQLRFIMRPDKPRCLS